MIGMSRDKYEKMCKKKRKVFIILMSVFTTWKNAEKKGLNLVALFFVNKGRCFEWYSVPVL